MTDLTTLFGAEERQGLRYPDMTKEATPHVTRFLRPAPGRSHILYSRLGESDADAVIQEEIAYFAARGLPFDWKVYKHDRPADLGKRLIAHGFEADEREAVMVLRLADAPSSLLAPVQADVRRLETCEGLEDAIGVESRVWGGSFDWIGERLGSHLELPGYLSVYVAYKALEPACCGWTYYPEGRSFASLWGGSTLLEHRGRGLYRAVLAARVQEALARERSYLSVDAGPMSRPILEGHGFTLLTYAQDYAGPVTPTSANG